MLVLTPRLFLQWQIIMSAVIRAFFALYCNCRLLLFLYCLCSLGQRVWKLTLAYCQRVIVPRLCVQILKIKRLPVFVQCQESGLLCHLLRECWVPLLSLSTRGSMKGGFGRRTADWLLLLQNFWQSRSWHLLKWPPWCESGKWGANRTRTADSLHSS